MNISEYSVKRPVTILMATISVLVLGYIALTRLPLALLPEMSSSHLRVQVDYPSSSPEEIERIISRPLEEYLSTLNGLESISTWSRTSGANVSLEFVDGMDMDIVSLEVRDRLDQARANLPDDVERIMIRRWQTTDMPIFRFAIGWTGDKDSLYRVVDEIITRRIERINGVASVDLRGADEKQIIVEVDDGLLQAYGIDSFTLSQALNSNNISLTGGYIMSGDKKFTLRSIGEYRTIEDIKKVPLTRNGLTIGDVADIRFDFPEQYDFSRLNGEEAVTMMVYKASTANVVSVCQDIQEELVAIQEMPSLSGKLTIQVYNDQSEQILGTLNDLKTAGIYGGILAMIVLFLFLMKVRSTLIIGMAIPVSIVFTCAFLFLMRVIGGSDITLNTISLMGMMVAVGMLVDNSVVVLENIFRYRQDKGLPAIEAAIRGSREVSVAVLASTATTVAVFASFIFMPNGISGRFMRDFGITVAVALVASLIVSVTIVPMVASRIFAGKEKSKQRIILMLEAGYRKVMQVFLRWRFVSIIMMAGLGFLTYYLFSHIEREFYPNVAEREISFNILLERSLSLDTMVDVYERLENLLLENAEELEIASISSRFSNNSTRRGQYWGSLDIILTEEGDLTPTLELREKIEGMFPVIPGVEYRPGRMRRMGGGSDMGIALEVSGEDPAMLEIWANVIKERLQAIPGLSNVQTSLETGDDEIRFSADTEKLEKFGLSSRNVAQTVSSALSSRAATKVKGDSGEIDVIVYLRGENEISLTELMNINLQNRSGEMIPIHSVVDFEYAKGPVALERENRKMTVAITADTEKGGSFFASQEAQSALEGLNMPAGYSWSMGRGWRDARQGEQESMFSIYLALILMYIIMASLFENFIHPLTILCTVPFSLIGVAWIFYATGTSLSQMAYLGILVLFGIVVNNGIILLDHINFLRRSGMPRTEAIIQGGSDRMRPILMTAATSIFGMLPLTLPYIFPTIFGGGAGSGYWEPVSLAVLGGLTTSTFLTLLILPPVYSYMDDLSSIVMWVVLRIVNPRLLLPARWRMSTR